MYTRKGDDGQTGTLSGDRLQKDHPLFEAGGALDELSAHIGLIRAKLDMPKSSRLRSFLELVQRDVANLGAYVSSGDLDYLEKLVLGPPAFEALIDQVAGRVPVDDFVVPGKSEIEALFHLARTVCRRAERRIVALAERSDRQSLVYLNRLSDLLFALALWTQNPFELNFP